MAMGGEAVDMSRDAIERRDNWDNKNIWMVVKSADEDVSRYA